MLRDRLQGGDGGGRWLQENFPQFGTWLSFLSEPQIATDVTKVDIPVLRMLSCSVV